MASHSLINLSRDTKVYFSTATLSTPAVKGDFGAADTFEIPVLDGYSFSQSTATQEIQLDEAGAAPNRGSRSFNTAINPVDWSISTYIRPFDTTVVAGGVTTYTKTAVEKRLWNAFAGHRPINSGTATTGTIGSGWNDKTSTTSMPADGGKMQMLNSNAHQMESFHLVFVVDNVTYVVRNAAITSAEMDFSIDAIATVAWTGFGQELEEVVATGTFGSTAVNDTDTSNSFITNKLSTISLVEVGSTGSTVFDVPITSGNLSIENNITYLTPEELGTVNKPISAYYSGARSVTGSLSAYLRSGTSTTDTGALLKSLVNNTETENFYKIVVNVGGVTGNRVVAEMPAVQLQIPSVDVADVIGTTISFVAQGSTGTGASTKYDITANNEVSLEYKT